MGWPKAIQDLLRAVLIRLGLGYREIIANGAHSFAGASELHTFDLGEFAADPGNRWPHVLEAALPDGTRSTVRVLHSDTDGQDPTAEGQLAGGSGPYYWQAHHRYVHVRRLFAGTVVTISAIKGDGIR